MILSRQVRRQQTNRRQTDGPIRQQLQNYRKAPRHASGLDPSIGGVLGETEDLRAIGKEGRTALSEVQAPRVQLRERRNKMRRRVTLV